MTDSYPPNPFNRQSEDSDSRNSRLFATGQGVRHEPLESKPYEENNYRTPSRAISSRREIRIKKSELRRNILIAVSVFLGLVMALIATDTWKVGTGPKPSFSQSLSNVSPQSSQTARVAGEQVELIRELNADDPLRVYIGGDSLVGSFGPALATSLGQTGVVKATYDSRVSSGLVNKGFFNWETHLRKMTATYKPELIVFMVGTNDASFVSSNPKDYEDKYSELLESFLEIAQENDRKVVLVLAPAMKESALNKNVKKLNDVITTVAKNNSVMTIESGKVLSPTGKFVTSVQLSKKVNVRSDDGVHLSNEGGKLLSQLIQNFLFSKFGIGRFEGPNPIKAVKVPGCCSSPKVVPSGTVKSNSTSSTNSSSSSTTTSETIPANDEEVIPSENETESVGE